MNNTRIKRIATSRAGLLGGAAAIGFAALALWTESKARRAERDHPPRGRFIDVDGVRLHYVERGQGPAVVLLHGNAVSLLDFEASGLIDALARAHRVIAFDRPGFGYSERPRDRVWTPATQADLLHKAFGHLNIERPLVVGHSMGTMVGVALALDHGADVGGLILLGGYFYPTVRVDALMTAPVALPLIGDVMRYTVTPVAGRLMIESSVRAMFAPMDVPNEFFEVLSREMMLRPVQLRANAEDAAFMVPAAVASHTRLQELRMPVLIVAGAEDGVVDHEAHSQRLHADLPQSQLSIVSGTGHMVHYGAVDLLVGLVSRHFGAATVTSAVPMNMQVENAV